MIQFAKKHYHWIVAVVLLLLMAIRGGTANNLSGLHLLPVTEALDITRSQFSFAVSASWFAAMLAVMSSGVLACRFDYRSLLCVFMLVGTAGYVLMAVAKSYPLFFLGYTLLGLNAGICAEAGITRLVSAWFHKYRGTVLGVISSATGWGASILCIFQTAAIERSTYKASYYLVAILLAVCAVLAWTFVRSHPGKMDLLPYGQGETMEYKKREHKKDHWQGLSMKQLVRRPAFYMMFAGTLISCILPNLALPVIVPHLQDRGLSVAEASGMQSVMMLCLAGAKILTGYLCDAIGARKVALLCMALDVVALLLLAFTTGVSTALIAVILFALALPITTVVVPLLATSLFGYSAQMEYTGLFISMVSASAIISTPIPNVIFDKVGSYSPVFLVAAALTVPLMGFYLLMYYLADRDRKKQEQTQE